MKNFNLKIQDDKIWQKVKIHKATRNFTNLHDAIFDLLERGLK